MTCRLQIRVYTERPAPETTQKIVGRRQARERYSHKIRVNAILKINGYVPFQSAVHSVIAW